MKILLEEGLSGITEAERDKLAGMVNDLLALAEPAPENIEEEPDEKPEPC